MGIIEVTSESSIKKSRYIKIPKEFIFCDTGINDKEILVYAYFATRKGLDNVVAFSIEHVITWCGYKLKRGAGKTNEIFTDIINSFADKGYISLSEPLQTSSVSKFNIAVINDSSKFSPSENYAIVYLDELEKILNYEKYIGNVKFPHTTPTLLLLRVFAYLRLKIKLRKSQPTNGDSSEEYMKKYPEAYNCYYKDISENLNNIVSERLVSSAASALVLLSLIHIEELNREKVGNNWYTGQTIFTNYGKRNKDIYGEIVDIFEGYNYYNVETELKKEILNNMKKRT